MPTKSQIKVGNVKKKLGSIFRYTCGRVHGQKTDNWKITSGKLKII